jgi:hypothetical protein
MKKNYNAGKTHISSYPFCENSKNSWPSQNYIEKDFPVEYLTPIVAREANSRNPIYQMHKWWDQANRQAQLDQTSIADIVTKAIQRYVNRRLETEEELDDVETAQTMMDGLRLYYNFIRPHTALEGKTPAQKAKLVPDKERENWLSLIKKASKQRYTRIIS